MDTSKPKITSRDQVLLIDKSSPLEIESVNLGKKNLIGFTNTYCSSEGSSESNPIRFLNWFKYDSYEKQCQYKKPN